MAIKEDGGPAFPFNQDAPAGTVGMSLRDWFAGQALAGMCANPDFTQATASRLQGYAFEIADAMLKARQS